jgi:hypothetical protein
VPVSLVVPAGQKTASLIVRTSNVTASVSATITAKYNGVADTTGVTITPVVLPALSSLAFSQTSVGGGANATLTILLSAAAPSAGATIAFSSNSNAFPVPAIIAIPAGYIGANVAFETLSVTVPTSVTITATYNGVTKTAGITLTPVVNPTVTALSMGASSLIGGSTATLTITLSGPAPSGGTIIGLTSSNAAFPLPASVEMPAGGVSGTLRLQTRAVSTAVTATVTASAGGTTKTATVTVEP